MASVANSNLLFADIDRPFITRRIQMLRELLNHAAPVRAGLEAICIRRNQEYDSLCVSGCSDAAFDAALAAADDAGRRLGKWDEQTGNFYQALCDAERDLAALDARAGTE